MIDYENEKAKNYAQMFLKGLREAIERGKIDILNKVIKEIRGDEEIRLFVLKQEIGKELGIKNPYSITSSIETVGHNIFCLSMIYGLENTLEIIRRKPNLLNCCTERLLEKIRSYQNISLSYGISLEDIISSNERRINRKLVNLHNNKMERKERETENNLLKTFRELEENDPLKIITLERAAKEMRIDRKTLIKTLKDYSYFHKTYMPFSIGPRKIYVHVSLYPYLQEAIEICIVTLCEKRSSYYAYIRNYDILKLIKEKRLILREQINPHVSTVLHALVETFAPTHFHRDARRGIYHIFSRDIIEKYKERISSYDQTKSFKVLVALLFPNKNSKDYF